MAEKLSQGWKQQMVVENRPGAGGIPGMSAFIKMARTAMPSPSCRRPS